MNISKLNFAYGDKRIFDDFDMQIPVGQVTCIMGESGCGKTTLLNCISGQLNYGGEILNEGGSAIAYVFQQPRLITSLTVKENIKYVLKGSKEERESKAKDMLAKLQLNDCADSYPRYISGGQAGRAALARALAIDSDILLMDEPFKGLDLKLKSDILRLLLPLVKDKTVAFVTHDVEEALAVGDVVYVLKRSAGESARIVAREQINAPQGERNLYSDELNAARKSLYENLIC